MSNNADRRLSPDEEPTELGDDSEDVSFDDDMPPLSSTPSAVKPKPTAMFTERYRNDWPPNAGALIAERYRVTRLLAHGGMGVVVVAKHEQLGKDVAIKFLNPESMSDPDVVMRFKREARALATIQSDHVVRVIDIGALETGEPYMVMEYLEGTDLAKLVKRRGPLPVDEAVGYVLQACEPLAEAHAAGIVHRDLKPSNLYLAKKPDGSRVVKVIDFGISKMPSGASMEGEMSVTKTQAILGSPLYIAPEQLKSARTVDARADIWALGVILHKLITGHPPFMGDTMAQLCAMVLLEPAPSITSVRPEAPAGLAQVILRCLEKDPGARHQTIAELASALLPYASSGTEAEVPRLREILSQPPPPPLPVVNASASGPRLEVGPSLARGALESVPASQWNAPALGPQPRSRAPFVASMIALTVIVAAGVVLFARRDRWLSPPPPPASALRDDTVSAPIVTVRPTAAPEPSAHSSAPEAATQGTTQGTGAAALGASASASAKPKPPRPVWTGGAVKHGGDNPEFGDRK